MRMDGFDPFGTDDRFRVLEVDAVGRNANVSQVLKTQQPHWTDLSRGPIAFHRLARDDWSPDLAEAANSSGCLFWKTTKHAQRTVQFTVALGDIVHGVFFNGYDYKLE